jgi:hypothetical protein
VIASGGSTFRVLPRSPLGYDRLAREARYKTAIPNARVSFIAAVLALAGVVLPQELQISLGAGARFTPGRVAAILLLLPALIALSRKGRHLVLCDFLVVAAAAWMIVASFSAAGIGALPTSGGEALDLLGGYLIARAFFFGRPALDAFVKVFRVATTVAVVFAVADSISGRLIVHETIGSWYGVPWNSAGLRNGWVRAAASFDHPILFGLYCALAAAILLYWDKDKNLRRGLGVSVCLLGCLLSWSSAALMTFSIVLGIYSYDTFMKQFPWRWKILWIGLATIALAIFVASEHPLGWVISHLTLDPQTGFFRILIWDIASTYIVQSPWIGYAYASFNNEILDWTIDSVWLVYTVRFGVPMVILLLGANLAAIGCGRQTSREMRESEIDHMRRAFTIVLLLFMLAGLTVHYWNYMLMFWGLSLGIRASLQELLRGAAVARSITPLAAHARPRQRRAIGTISPSVTRP